MMAVMPGLAIDSGLGLIPANVYLRGAAQPARMNNAAAPLIATAVHSQKR